MNKDQFTAEEILHGLRGSKDSVALDTPIYRFMSFDALQEMLLAKNIWLVKTKYWEDTYENFLFHSDIWADDIPFDLSVGKERTFGNCWTMIEESDALWRIYSPSRSGVRIKTTVRKLVKSIQQQFTKATCYSANIGKVKYMKVDEIVAYFENIDGDTFVAEAHWLMRDSMFMKRKEFDHEDEIRIIVRMKGEINDLKEVAALQIDPDEIVEEVTFDPRINDDLYKLFCSKLQANSHDMERVSKSKLYSNEKLKIRFKNSSPTEFKIV